MYMYMYLEYKIDSNVVNGDDTDDDDGDYNDGDDDGDDGDVDR